VFAGEKWNEKVREIGGSIEKTRSKQKNPLEGVGLLTEKGAIQGGHKPSPGKDMLRRTQKQTVNKMERTGVKEMYENYVKVQERQPHTGVSHDKATVL